MSDIELTGQMLLVACLNLVFAALGSLLIWRFYGKKIVYAEAGSAVINRIIKPDPQTKEALFSIFDVMTEWLFTERETGGKVQIPTAEIGPDKKPVMREIDERLTPFDAFAGKLGGHLFNKVRGKMGGDAFALNKMMGEVGADLGMGGGLPVSPASLRALTKGNPGPALMELGMRWWQEKKLNPEATTPKEGTGPVSSGLLMRKK